MFACKIKSEYHGKNRETGNVAENAVNDVIKIARVIDFYFFSC